MMVLTVSCVFGNRSLSCSFKTCELEKAWATAFPSGSPGTVRTVRDVREVVTELVTPTPSAVKAKETISVRLRLAFGLVPTLYSRDTSN